MHVFRPLLLASSALLLSALTSCDRNNEIKVYKVEKESDAPATTAPKDPHAGIPMPSPGEADPHAGLGIGSPSKPPGVTGDVPDSWKPGRGSSMRLASYVVHGEDDAIADISLIILGGGAGGLLDNVNRWRAQVKLPAVDDATLAQSSSTMATPQGDGTVVDLQATSPVDSPAKDGRIVGVIVPRPDEIWFYKMRGNPDLVAREKEGFLRWVESAEKSETPPPSAPAPPVSVPETPAPAPPGMTWTVPEAWRPVPAKSMRVASFSTGDPDDPLTPAGDVSVIKLGGDGGGDLANVNRWRQQIGLGPLTADELASSVTGVQSPAGTISLVACTGQEQSTLAAWIRHEDATWFIKLTGPSAVVEAEQARFRSFLASLDFPAQ